MTNSKDIYLLCLETSGSVCSVSVCLNGQTLAVQEVTIDKSHAEKITLLITQACEQANIVLSQLAAVAISKGPGSYTGLRIASSTAKGICFGLDIPLIGIDTLQLMAKSAKEKSIHLSYQAICPMIDARRQEVFCAFYGLGAALLHPHSAEILQMDSFSQLLAQEKILFCGDGSPKFKAVCTSPNALFLDNVYPHASDMAAFAYHKFTHRQFEDTVLFEPFYLKEFYMGKPE